MPDDAEDPLTADDYSGSSKNSQTLHSRSSQTTGCSTQSRGRPGAPKPDVVDDNVSPVRSQDTTQEPVQGSLPPLLPDPSHSIRMSASRPVRPHAESLG